MCFLETTALTRGMVGSAFGVTGLLFIWCIQRVSGMETQRQQSYQDLFSATLEKLRVKKWDGSKKAQPPTAKPETGDSAV